MARQLAPRGRWSPGERVETVSFGLVCAASAICAALVPTAVSAQTITGTIRETGSGQSVAGAFAALVDSTGATVAARFTTAGGTFSLTAARAGRYRVRIERIGYEAWTSPFYALGVNEYLPLDVEMAPQPIELAELDIRIERSCFMDESDGDALSVVWEEARKALESAVWAEGQSQLTFDIAEYERTLEPKSMSVRDARTQTRRHVRLPPFESLPVATLMAAGFATVGPDSSVFYAPDATVLLSQEFRNAYCFGLRREVEDGRSLIGITFEPRSRRRAVDIEGVLWLSQESAELRRVELRYRNLALPRGTDRRAIGANLTFDRLPDGPFFVRDWWIQFPVSAGQFGGQRRDALASDLPLRVLTAYKRTGGTIIEAYIGRRPVWSEGIVSVAGFVYDSATGGPLSGALVRLRDWADAAAFRPVRETGEAELTGVTDQEGAFEIFGVPDGVYAARVEHPKTRAAGLRTRELRVVVEDGASVPLELFVPSNETIYRSVCPSARQGRALGAIVGFVRDAATGAPVADVAVTGQWRVNRISLAGRTPNLDTQSEYVGAVSDSGGRFVLCNVPAGEAVFLKRKDGDTGVSVQLNARVVWQDIPIDP